MNDLKRMLIVFLVLLFAGVVFAEQPTWKVYFTVSDGELLQVHGVNDDRFLNIIVDERVTLECLSETTLGVN